MFNDFKTFLQRGKCGRAGRRRGHGGAFEIGFVIFMLVRAYEKVKGEKVKTSA